MLLSRQKAKLGEESGKKFSVSISKLLQQRPCGDVHSQSLDKKKNFFDDWSHKNVRHIENYILSRVDSSGEISLESSRVKSREYKDYSFMIEKLQKIKEEVEGNRFQHQVSYFASLENPLFEEDELEHYSAWKNALEPQKERPFK